MEPSGSDLSELIDGARYWQRRRRVVVGAIAVALLAALAIGIAIGLRHSSLGPIDVTASLEEAGIFHYAIESTAALTSSQFGSGKVAERPMLVDLATGGERPITQTNGYWYDPVRRQLSTERIVDGTRMIAGTLRFLEVGGAPEQVIALDELSTLGIGRVLANHDGSKAGRGVLYGHSISWVLFQSSLVAFEVAVDARSGRLVALRSVCSTCGFDSVPQRLVDVGHVDAVPDRLPRTPTQVRGTLGLASGGVSSRSQPVPLAFSEAARALSEPTLYVGKVFDGLELRTTRLVVTTTTDGDKATVGPRLRSVEFGYGSGPLTRTSAPGTVAVPSVPVSHFPRSVSILETTTPSVNGGFFRANGHLVALGPGLADTPIPPQGQALLGALTPASGITELWLRRGPLYITIQASSPTLAVDAARHLQRVPH